MQKAIKANNIAWENMAFLPQPFADRMAGYVGRRISDHFELNHFAVHLVSLQPGSQSALRHWHTKSEEFVYILEGTLNLVTDDGEEPLRAGMCMGFKAGTQNAHHLVNRGHAPARFLVIGSRVDGDRVHYPDDDFQWKVDEDGNWMPCSKDGTPLT